MTDEKEKSALPPIARPAPLLTEAQLHPYQAFCVSFIEAHPACGIFLDMGLGKTSIALTAIEHLLHDSFEVSRVPIVAPLRVARPIGETWKPTHKTRAGIAALLSSRAIGCRPQSFLLLRIFCSRNF